MSEWDDEIVAWRELTDVSDEEVDRLRRDVTARVARRRRRPLWATAMAASLVLGAAVAWTSRPEVETLALRMPVPPPAPEVRLSPPRPVVARRKAAPAASVIKIYTDDPDVVILLVADGGED